MKEYEDILYSMLYENMITMYNKLDINIEDTDLQLLDRLHKNIMEHYKIKLKEPIKIRDILGNEFEITTYHYQMLSDIIGYKLSSSNKDIKSIILELYDNKLIQCNNFIYTKIDKEIGIYIMYKGIGNLAFAMLSGSHKPVLLGQNIDIMTKYLKLYKSLNIKKHGFISDIVELAESVDNELLLNIDKDGFELKYIQCKLCGYSYKHMYKAYLSYKQNKYNESLLDIAKTNNISLADLVHRVVINHFELGNAIEIGAQERDKYNLTFMGELDNISDTSIDPTKKVDNFRNFMETIVRNIMEEDKEWLEYSKLLRQKGILD